MTALKISFYEKSVILSKAKPPSKDQFRPLARKAPIPQRSSFEISTVPLASDGTDPSTSSG
jgi:hypothetical protein